MSAGTRVIGLVWAWFALASFASAQVQTDRPIRLIVPFAPGGGSDVMGRILALKVSEVLGQQVIVENRSGAGGNIGAAAVAKAAPDGQTLLMANVALGINAGFPGNLPFNVLKDFSPVALVGNSALVVAVHPSVPVKSLPELIALAKSRPGSLSYSSCGTGTLQHLGAELLKNLATFHMLHIPYRGCAQAVAATVGGDVPVTFNAISNVVPFVNAAQLRLLGVGSEKRSAAYPGVPTIAEAGFGSYDADLWIGVLAPAGTPAPVISRLNSAFNKVLAMPDVQESYRKQLFESRSGTPEEFSLLLQREVTKWTRLIKAANIKPD